MHSPFQHCRADALYTGINRIIQAYTQASREWRCASAIASGIRRARRAHARNHARNGIDATIVWIAARPPGSAPPPHSRSNGAVDGPHGAQGRAAGRRAPGRGSTGHDISSCTSDDRLSCAAPPTLALDAVPLSYLGPTAAVTQWSVHDGRTRALVYFTVVCRDHGDTCLHPHVIVLQKSIPKRR